MYIDLNDVAKSRLRRLSSLGQGNNSSMSTCFPATEATTKEICINVANEVEISLSEYRSSRGSESRFLKISIDASRLAC